MELFNRSEFAKLGEINERLTATIYIPTHESGKDVNESIDRIAFKNEVQKIRKELGERNYKNTTKFLKPVQDIIENEKFWKNLSKGLAVFLTENYLRYYRLPISFPILSLIGPRFELTPLLPMLQNNDTFYTLSLSLNKIRLFKNDTFTFHEIDVSDLIPSNTDEIISYYEFETQPMSMGTNTGSFKGSFSKGNLAVHGYNPEDKSYKYTLEFLERVNEGISQKLRKEKAPLVIASVNNLFGLYKEVNTYKYTEKKGIMGNPDRVSEKDLHEKSYKIVREIINKPRKTALEKYGMLGGTGKTSYELDTILAAAYDGRIESLFLLENHHLWGNYDSEKRKSEIHEEKEKDDICLLSLAASKTLENNGKAYLVEIFEMPEIEINTPIAAVFRY